MTDYYALGKMDAHGVAPLKEAAARALLAGTDMDMVSCSSATFPSAIDSSNVFRKPQETISLSCRC